MWRTLLFDKRWSYFFSPAAAKVFAHFIRHWEGFGCSEPHNLDEMEIVL